MSLLFQSFTSIDAIEDCVRYCFLLHEAWKPEMKKLLTLHFSKFLRRGHESHAWEEPREFQWVNSLPVFTPEQRAEIDAMMKESQSC